MNDLLPPIAVPPPPPVVMETATPLWPYLAAAAVVAVGLLLWWLRRPMRRLWWRLRLNEARVRQVARACYRAEGRRLAPQQRQVLERALFAPHVSRETVQQVQEVIDAL